MSASSMRSAYWDWQHHARAGIVFAQGPVQDNESSKIYYYLRTGLPVIMRSLGAGISRFDRYDLMRGAIVPYGDIEGRWPMRRRSGSPPSARDTDAILDRYDGGATFMGRSRRTLRPGAQRRRSDAGGALRAMKRACGSRNTRCGGVSRAPSCSSVLA